MKNVFKKYIKMLDKADNVIVSRQGDNYFIGNGYIVVSVSAAIYNVYFQTEKPYYRDLQDNTSIQSIRGKRKEGVLFEETSFLDYNKCFPDPFDLYPCKQTTFLFDTPEYRTNLFTSEKKVIAVNSVFIDALNDITTFYSDTTISTTNAEFSPIIYSDTDFKALVMPVRHNINKDIVNALINANMEQLPGGIVSPFKGDCIPFSVHFYKCAENRIYATNKKGRLYYEVRS